MVEIEKMTRMNRTLIDALSEERAVRQRLEEKLASHGVFKSFLHMQHVIFRELIVLRVSW